MCEGSYLENPAVQSIRIDDASVLIRAPAEDDVHGERRVRRSKKARGVSAEKRPLRGAIVGDGHEPLLPLARFGERALL